MDTELKCPKCGKELKEYAFSFLCRNAGCKYRYVKKYPPNQEYNVVVEDRIMGDKMWELCKFFTATVTDGCVASPHWEACKTCKNNDNSYGCVIKELIPLSLHLGDFIICDDYEKRQLDNPIVKEG